MLRLAAFILYWLAFGFRWALSFRFARPILLGLQMVLVIILIAGTATVISDGATRYGDQSAGILIVLVLTSLLVGFGVFRTVRVMTGKRDTRPLEQSIAEITFDTIQETIPKSWLHNWTYWKTNRTKNPEPRWGRLLVAAVLFIFLGNLVAVFALPLDLGKLALAMMLTLSLFVFAVAKTTWFLNALPASLQKQFYNAPRRRV